MATIKIIGLLYIGHSKVRRDGKRHHQRFPVKGGGGWYRGQICDGQICATKSNEAEQVIAVDYMARHRTANPPQFGNAREIGSENETRIFAFC